MLFLVYVGELYDVLLWKVLSASFLIKHFRNASSYLLNLKYDIFWIKINIYNYLGCHYVTSTRSMKDFFMTFY